MDRTHIARLSVTLLFLSFSWIAYTQNQGKQAPQLTINKVKDDLYNIKGDAVIYFPALRTIHTGDLMAGTSPLIDYPGGGSVVEWTKTLDAAMKLDFDTVIPGHGKVTNKAGLLAYRDNVEKLRNRVSGLIREGTGQDDVGKAVMAEYGWAAGSLNMQWSLPGMMA